MRMFAMLAVLATPVALQSPTADLQEPPGASNADARVAQIAHLMEGYAKNRAFSGAILVAEKG